MSDPPVLIVADDGDRPDAGMILALSRENPRLRVLTPSQGKLAHWLREWDVPFEPLHLHRQHDAGAAETIRWHIDELRPRILQVTGPFAAANGLRAVRRRPVVVVAHRGGAGGPRVLNAFDRAAILSARISRVVCCSDSVRRSFLRFGFGPLRVPPRRLVTIHPGHDADWYRPPPIATAALGVPRNAFTVSCASINGRSDGMRDVVQACEYLPVDLPIYFLAHGAGGGDGPLVRLVERSSYRDRFQLLGRRPDAARVAVATDVCVLAGADDGLPSVLFEWMLRGTTPVVTDASAAEIVEHDRSGLVVPPASPQAIAAAILRLYNDRETCRRLGAGARRRIAGAFTVQHAATAMRALYRDVVSGP